MGANTDTASESRPLVTKPIMHDFAKNVKVNFLKKEIILNPFISVTNFTSLMIFSAYLGFILVPINMLQLPLLRILYDEDRPERDTTTAISQSFEIVTCIIMAPIYGILCDKYGRKPLIAYGMTLTCLATVLMPYLPGVYPYFILLRLVFINGYTSMVVTPLLADYIDSRTQGSVAAIMNILGNLGALLAINLVQDKELNNTIGSKLVHFGSQSFLFGVFLLLGLKQGTYHKKNPAEFEDDVVADQSPTKNYSTLEVLDEIEETEKLNHIEARQAIGTVEAVQTIVIAKEEPVLEKPQQKEGIIASIKKMNNLPLVIGYMLGFLGTCQGCLLGFALINYSTSSTGNENAAVQSYVLANASIMIGVLTSAVYGFCADQLSKFKLGFMTVAFSTIGISIMIEAYDPYGNAAYVSMGFFGLAASGFSILNGQIISKHADARYRGTIYAINTIICTLGTGAINVIGLYLSQNNPLIPFYMCLGFSISGLVAMLVVYWKRYEVIRVL